MLFERNLLDLLSQARKIREQYFENTVELRIAHNYLTVRRCTADCGFCSWSRVAKLDYAKEQKLIVGDEGGIDISSCMASAELANRFSASMELISNIERLEDEYLLKELLRVIEVASKITSVGVQTGLISPMNKEYLLRLKQAGLS